MSAENVDAQASEGCSLVLESGFYRFSPDETQVRRTRIKEKTSQLNIKNKRG